MAMARGRKGAGQGTVGKAAALIELKHRILQTLHKLSDRDTQQLAVEELERIAQSLSPEGIALFLACLYDTDAQQKSVVRRECIRLVGTLATLHGDLLACHLPKMVGNIIRRLKDPDSNIRDACVDTIGVLASQIGGPEPGSTTNVFIRPLLEALAEQHRNLQTGASMCLARVVECIKDGHVPTLQRLCPRVVKMLGSPNFLAKASLLNAVGVMVQVPGVVSMSQLPVLLGSAQEELDSSEWAVRKAAAEALSCMATATGTALGSYRGGVLAALENSRFDKVKPVRDSVCEALQLWKNVYDPNAMQGGTPTGSHDSASPTRFCEGDATPPSPMRRHSMLMKSAGSVNSSFSESLGGRPKSMPDRRVSLLKKRVSAFGDKKANPDFFRKMEGAGDTIDWQVEIAVPREAPQEGLSPRACGVASSENLVYHGNCTGSTPLTNDNGEAPCPPEVGNGADDLQYDQEENGLPNPTADIVEKIIGDIVVNGYQELKTEGTVEDPERWENSQANEHQNCEHISQWNSNASNPMIHVDKEALDMVSVHRHFHSLERQQLSMMEMLQDSMVRVHESMQGLEERVSRLEQIVGGMAQSSSTAEARSSVDDSQQSFQGGHAYLSENGFTDGRVSEDNPAPSSARSLSNSLESTSGDLDEFTFVRSGHEMELLRRPSVLGLQKGDILVEQGGARRGSCDRGGALPLQGEGPSARSVWHASKDEAIAAIRGAAVPSKPHNHHHRKHSNRDVNNADQKPQQRVAGGPFWMLWSRAMESVRSGDLDVAYSEILGSNDDLLLVRLMGRTGPVLEQLGVSTASQLLSCIKQFLQQQSFLDCIIPWLQQVSDLVSSKGPNTLGLMGETKKDLVHALQDARSMDYAQSWMGAKIAELAEQLGNAWSTANSSELVDAR